MYKNAIFYQGIWLVPGSEAYKMYKDSEFVKLAKHLNTLSDKKRKLEGLPLSQ